MKKIFTIIFLLNIILFPAQDSIIFVIRVDDIQSRNTTTLPRSINDFQNAVEARGGKITWAVIPHRLIETQNYNGILSAELRASVLRGHEISMHGYNHICKRCASSGHEMFCTSYNTPFTLEEQEAIIDSGLKVLRDTLGIIPKSFVPPAHIADTNTWRALINRSFPFLSSTGVRKNFIFNGLFNLPAHNEFTWQLTQAQFNLKLNQALQEIKTNGVSDGYYCLLLHDPFIRAGYENSLVINWTAVLLDSLNSYFGNRIKYMTISEAGLYFRDGSTTGIEATESIAEVLPYLQNYPNPFRSYTRIKYTIPTSPFSPSPYQGEGNKTSPFNPSPYQGEGKRERFVSLRVYDLLGREIAVLVDEEKAPGEYEVEFNASDLPSGVYMYRLIAGSNVETRKMILLR